MMNVNSNRSIRRSARLALVGATTMAVVGAAACSGGDSELSELAQLGRSTAISNGCASCHGANGQGAATGPAWIDLAGSERVLVDGTTVIADDDYLLRSILEPDAEIVAGYNLRMPTNGLSEAQAREIIVYIKELTSDEGG